MANDTIMKDKVVSFDFTMKDGDGEVLDQSTPDDPGLYLHGYDNILPGLEEAFLGKKVGDTFQITLAPEDAFGEEDEEDEGVEIPRDAFEDDFELEVGLPVEVEGEDGEVELLWIEDVEDDVVYVSRSHPLAGLTIQFDVKVTDIRDATKEELEHGHPHGEGEECEDCE